MTATRLGRRSIQAMRVDDSLAWIRKALAVEDALAHVYPIEMDYPEAAARQSEHNRHHSRVREWGYLSRPVSAGVIFA